MLWTSVAVLCSYYWCIVWPVNNWWWLLFDIRESFWVRVVTEPTSSTTGSHWSYLVSRSVIVTVECTSNSFVAEVDMFTKTLSKSLKKMFASYKEVLSVKKLFCMFKLCTSCHFCFAIVQKKSVMNGCDCRLQFLALLCYINKQPVVVVVWHDREVFVCGWPEDPPVLLPGATCQRSTSDVWHI